MHEECRIRQIITTSKRKIYITRDGFMPSLFHYIFEYVFAVKRVG